MIEEILLPDLGEGIEGAEVSEVSVSVGTKVHKDETVLVLESDKASMEIPTEVSGVILEILVSPGDEVTTGQLLIKIESEEVSVAERTIDVLEKESLVAQIPSAEKKPELVTEKLISGNNNDSFASPGVRRLARELGINLSTINGTGPKKRTTKEDLHSFIKMQMAMSTGKPVTVKKEIDFSQWGEIETLKLSKINKITGQRLQQAWQEIPHVTQYDKADITDVDILRKKLKKEGLEKNIKVTFLPFLMKAVSIALKEMPRFNSSLDHVEENLVIKKFVNIGVAVDTPNGLMVPCVKSVDKKNIFELSEELMELSLRARDKKLRPEELKGSSFTISSLGGIGGTAFSPIVNPPEVAIMGVSRSEWSPVFNKESKDFEPKYLMPYSVSYDHRVIDGAAAATFTSRINQILLKAENFTK
ncbi:2-oxo acid dehydrogenase subunit E2 [Candidatus Marinimicrobia bacterium]|nr:2-oxo acid dehydrogenase subunit E2 [Candidatus Neomarinimicrobiota bacterium]